MEWCFMQILQIIQSILLSLVTVITSLFSSQSVPFTYQLTTKTGGELEANYLKNGEYQTSYNEISSLQGFGKYIISYPKELESSNRIYPVVVFVNGTGVKASKYRRLFEHMASWGFIAIGTEEEYDWNGFASEMCIRLLKELNSSETLNDKPCVFYQKVDLDNVGITGHSQGGVGVFNAVTKQENKDIYKAAVAISPTNKELAANLLWDYDASLIKTPIFLLSGEGGGDDWVVTGEQLSDIYNDIKTKKIMARKINTAHGEMLYSADGYVTAWFMWKLQGDEEAAKAFTGEHPEIISNSLYQDVNISF